MLLENVWHFFLVKMQLNILVDINLYHEDLKNVFLLIHFIKPI